MNSFFRLLFNLTFSEFKNKKLKTSLTLLGIFISVFTIVLLVILTLSLKYGVVSQLDRFEPNQIILSTTNVVGQGPPIGFSLFSKNDIDYVKSFKEVDFVIERLTLIMNVKFSGENRKISVTGVTLSPYTEKLAQAKPVKGRFFNDNDKDKKVVVLGYKVYKDFFSKTVDVKKKLYINNVPFTVVGVMEETGSLAQDNMVYVPIDSFRKTFSLEGVTSMVLILKDNVNPDLFVDYVKKKLNRKLGRDVVEALTPAQLKNIIGNILMLVNILIVSIASISILVGSIGITNSLYSSVLQRKREIGTMKAVGAKNFQVMLIFLFESIILSFLGVLLGFVFAVFFSYILVSLMSKFSPYTLVFVVPLNFSVSVFLFSIILGIISGLYPAYQATKLPPTEALRYE